MPDISQIGFWFVMAWLDTGVPSTVMMYTYDHQRCLNVAKEHFEQVEKRPARYVELVYIGCPPGSPPRS